MVKKQVYYRFLLKLYSIAGRFADAHAANGTWTYNHVVKLWWNETERKEVKEGKQPHKDYVELIYPPCDTTDFSKKN